MLRVKHRRFSALDDYFDDGQNVATFDGGPCTIVFDEGKEYLIVFWHQEDEEIEDRIYPEGTAKIISIIDTNKEIVFDKASATSIFYGDNGEVRYYKSGESITVAHSEIPLNNYSNSNWTLVYETSEWMFVCNKKKYNVMYKHRLFYSISKIYESEKLIGKLFTIDFLLSHRTWTYFFKEMSLLERVFVTLLSFRWKLD